MPLPTLGENKTHNIADASPFRLVTNHRYPDSKVHGANMGSTWVLSAPDGPHFGPMNLAIRDNYAAILESS